MRFVLCQVADARVGRSARYERIDYSIQVGQLDCFCLASTDSPYRPWLSQDIDESVGASISISSDKAEVLMGKMRYPSLSIHGIEGAFSAAGAKTVIPAKISGMYIS